MWGSAAKVTPFASDVEKMAGSLFSTAARASPRYLRKPLPRLFERALLLIREIDMHESETLRITFGPFEVVEQAPDVVGPDARTVAHGSMKRREMVLDICDACGIVDLVARI